MSCLRTVTCLLPGSWNSSNYLHGKAMFEEGILWSHYLQVSSSSLFSTNSSKGNFHQIWRYYSITCHFFSCKVVAHIIGGKGLILLARRCSQALFWAWGAKVQKVVQKSGDRNMAMVTQEANTKCDEEMSMTESFSESQLIDHNRAIHR